MGLRYIKIEKEKISAPEDIAIKNKQNKTQGEIIDWGRKEQGISELLINLISLIYV